LSNMEKLPFKYLNLGIPPPVENVELLFLWTIVTWDGRRGLRMLYSKVLYILIWVKGQYL